MKVHLPELPLPISVDLVDDEGYPLPSRMENGLEIVEGTVGTQFKIRLENPNTPEIIESEIPRIYIVASVDGINVGDLETVNWTGPMSFLKGFIWSVDSGEPTQVDYLEGWLLNKHQLSRFKFVAKEDGFLASQYPTLFAAYKDIWVGKIELGFYVEKNDPFDGSKFNTKGGAIAVGQGEIVENPYEYLNSDFQFKDPTTAKPCGMANIQYKIRGE